MKVIIDWRDYSLQLRDLYELVMNHANQATVDGDRQILIIEDPDEYLLEELENRGIKYEVIGT